MYCVKCGVKLEKGVKSCPLCETPVMIFDNIDEVVKQKYSDLYPKEYRQKTFVALSFITIFLIATCLTTLIICLNLYGSASWSGYVMLSCALLYILFCLPFWFNKYYPFIFLPVGFAAIEGFLLYICLKTNGNWFLSFAFPVVAIICFIVMGALPLYKFIKKGRLFITGGLFIAMGCSTLLVELCDVITFGSKMFTWSLYCVCSLGLIGLFLIIAGIIKPLREYLERKLFI